MAGGSASPRSEDTVCSSARIEAGAADVPPSDLERPERPKRGTRGRRGRLGRSASLQSVALVSPSSSTPHAVPKAVDGSGSMTNAIPQNSIESLWTQLQRQRSPSRFLEFLRQGAQLAVGGEDAPSQGEESRSVLPCGLPYPPSVRSSAPASGRRRARWHRVRNRRLWINATVAYLDFLHLGKPGGAGLRWARVLQSPLSVQQWALAQKLESTYLAVCRLGETPESPSGGLEQLAQCLHVTMDYGGKRVPKATVVPVELRGDNMSLPDHAGLVPLKSPVVPPEFEAMLEEPDIFLRASHDMLERLPPWYMCVASWPDIAKQLLHRGLCRPVRPSEAQLWHGQHLRAGLFGVAKPDTKMRRVIIDRRRRNSIERCLRQVMMEKALREQWEPERLEHAWRLMTLPHGSQLGELLCSPRTTIRYASVRHAETIVGFNVATTEFTAEELCSLGIPADWPEVALALVSPAMGDQKSMEVAQLCHQHILLEHKAITPDSWITYRWPFPSSPICAGCYCDDFGQIAMGADDLPDPEMSVDVIMQSARGRIGRVHEGYRNSDLIRKEAKARAEEENMTLWGSSISGRDKTVRGALPK
eukprot:3223250-Amphidinium_carterae.1